MHIHSRLLLLLTIPALLTCGQPSTGPEENTSASNGDIPVEVQAKLDQYIIQDEDALATLAPEQFNPTDHLDDYDVYAVTYLWGSFHHVGGSSLVWDGKTSTNAEAAMRLVSAIDFETGEEIRFDPSMPWQMGWISSTLDDLDGVSFLLYVKRGVLYLAPPVLSFETGPITFSIPVEDLAHHQSFHPVDNASGVAVFARQVKRPPCPHGHLGGTWVFEQNTRTEGQFRGVWQARDGQIEGHLVGRFWTENDGSRHLTGQVSGVTTDQVILELAGTWALTPHLNSSACPDCSRVGYFVGRWKYPDGSGFGKFAGHFGEPDLTTPLPDLPFRGVWLQHCDHYAGDNSWSDKGE